MRVSAVALLLFVAGCQDQSLKAVNADPVAEILSPTDLATFLEGESIELRGSVSDPNASADQLVTVWLVDGAEVCSAAPPAEDGSTRCVTSLEAGTHEVALEVRDPDNATGRASISVTATTSAAPVVTILSPVEEQHYYTDEPIAFDALVSDAEDPPTALSLTWASNLDGPLSLAGAVGSDGSFSSLGYLTEGDHILTLTATDSHGQIGTDSAVVHVGPPNSAPSCGIGAPLDGATFTIGESVVLQGTVGDVDQREDSLIVAWGSSLDGDLGSAPPTSSGETALVAGSLSAGIHILTLSVEDDRGLTCSDQVVITVGSPPNIEITAPEDGGRVPSGESVTFSALVTDNESAPPALLVEWASDRDGVLWAGNPEIDGAVDFSTRDLSPGTHLLTLTASDPEGLTAHASVTLSIDAAPSAPAVQILPDPASTDDALTATLVSPSIDPEGGAISYTYRWYRDGVLSGASTSDTVPASATGRGEVWSVEVIPFDGFASGPAGTDDITVGNRLPTVTGLTLSPSPAYTNSTLTVVGSVYDADGDAVTLRYQWSVNGSVVAAATGPTLSGASYFSRDDSVSVVVTPFDGFDLGAPVAVGPVTIANTAPTAPVVRITPSSPRAATDALRCEVVTPATDADGDALTYNLSWTVGTTAYPDGRPGATGPTTTTLPDDTIPGADTRAAEVWTCTVTADDGFVEGGVGTASVTIATASLCGNGRLDPGEEVDPPVSPFSTVTVNPTTCRWDFSGVRQLYCNGSCTWDTASDCGSGDADMFCKLKTGNPRSTAISWTSTTALPEGGFPCTWYEREIFTDRGVSVPVQYQDASILANHGPGNVIVDPICTAP